MDILVFFLSLGLLVIIIYLFIRIALRIRKTGGTMSTTVHGALDAFYNHDKKRAAQVVVDVQAHKKMDEQASADLNNSKNTKNKEIL